MPRIHGFSANFFGNADSFLPYRPLSSYTTEKRVLCAVIHLIKKGMILMARLRAFILFLADIFVTVCSFSFCWYITRQYLTVDIKVFFSLLLLTLLVYPAVLLVFGVYQSLWRYAQPKEFFMCLAASITAGMLCFLLSRLLIKTIIPVYFYIFTTLAITIVLFLFRICYRLYRDYLQGKQRRDAVSHGLVRKRTLIIGGGEACRVLLSEIQTNPSSRICPVLICDRNPEKQGKCVMGVRIVSDKDGYEEICRKNAIEQIIIAIPSADNEVRASLLEKCSHTGCAVKILPRLSDLADTSCLSQNIRDFTMEELLGREPVNITDEKTLSFIRGKTVMVTGGGGSIGSELCRQVAAHRPRELIIVDIYENNAYDIQQELTRKWGENLHLTVLIASVRDKECIRKIIKTHHPDLLFHAAAHKHVPLMETSPAEAVKNNIFGTLNTAEAAGEAGVSKFVMISTDKAVNPTNVMGASKRVCEMIVTAMNSRYPGTRYSAVRFGNVLGSNGSVIPLFRKQIMEGGPVTVTHPDIIRYFMTIPEAAQLVLTSAALGAGGEIFVLDMGKPVRIDDLAHKMIQLSGLTPNRDIRIEYTGLRPGEKLYEELLTAEEGLLPTQHKQIFIGKAETPDAAQLFRCLDQLRETVFGQDSDEQLSDASCNANIVQILSALVPTFRHNSPPSLPSDQEILSCGSKIQPDTAKPARATV